MIQTVKVTFGNISHNKVLERVFDSRNAAFIWLNHQLVRESRCSTVHELYFRIESYSDAPKEDINVLPF